MSLGMMLVMKVVDGQHATRHQTRPLRCPYEPDLWVVAIHVKLHKLRYSVLPDTV